jgi:hypothetical protein
MGVRLTTSLCKETNCYETSEKASERNVYLMETKDWKNGLDIWHMERSDHAAARQDDGDATRRKKRKKMRWLDDLSTDLKKIGI